MVVMLLTSRVIAYPKMNRSSTGMRNAMARLKGSRRIWMSSFWAMALMRRNFIIPFFCRGGFKTRPFSRYLNQRHEHVYQRRHDLFYFPDPDILFTNQFSDL